jgi:DNA-binding LacI/PurR family transcriptional regulator
LTPASFRRIMKAVTRPMAATSSQFRSTSPQATLYDVSRLSGVSSATVSRVFSGRTKVSDEVRQRVMAAAKQLSYEPSHAARALAGSKTHTLGAIFPEIASGFYADVLAGVDEVAAEGGFDVLASFVGKHRSRSDLVRRLLRQGRVDALVLLNLDDSADLLAESVSNLPIVLIDREIRGSSLPVVGMDNVGGAEAMIEHLFEQGHRRIGIVTGPAGNYDSEQRLVGCKRAMTRLGLVLEDRWVIPGDFTLESGMKAARQCLDSRADLPDAFFCLNDLMGIGLMTEFQRAGLNVPGDIALAGYDNIETSAHLSLTSVASPMRLMGQIAARWAIDVAEKGERPASHNLQVRLVVRNSSSGRPIGPVRMRLQGEEATGRVAPVAAVER